MSVTLSYGQCISEDFTSFPDWTNNGTASDNTHAGISAPCRAFGPADSMISPAVNNPMLLEFYQDASGGGNGKNATVEYRIGAGAWVLFHTFAVTTAGNTESINLTNLGGVDLSIQNNVSFRFNSTFFTWYLDDVVVTCVSAPCVEPTAQANFHANSPINIATTSVTLNWTNGDGLNRIVVLSDTNAITFAPVDNTTYTANSVYGTGTAVAPNEFIVYNGNSNTVDVTGLTPGTTYYATIYEYNCTVGNEDYLITGTPTTDIFLTEPENPASFIKQCVNDTSIDLSWTAPSTGNFDGYLLVVRENAAPHSVNSIDPSSIVGSNLDYTLASTYGGTLAYTRNLYLGTNTSATVTGLTAGSNYTFKLFTYVDIGGIFEYSNGTTTSQIMALENVTNALAVGGNGQATITWTNPNNSCFDEILIVVNETAGIGFTPNGDGTAYTANSNYTGVNQVVYQNNGTNITVTNLTNGTTYYFEIFVRNGTTWSSGIEVSAIPNVQTIFNPGDLVIVAYDNKVGTVNDVVTILTMVDINPNTSFWYANATYEIGAPANVRTGEWRSCKNTSDAAIGAQRFTYTGPDILPAGSTFCITIDNSQILTSDFSVHQASGSGTYNFSDGFIPAGFVPSVNISTSNPDSIFLMQGSWSADLGGYRTFNGTVLGGIQDGANWYTIADDLSGALTVPQRRTSRIPPEIQCFAIQGTTSPSSGFAYYNGTKSGTQVALLSNIADFTTNWIQGAGTSADDVSANSCVASYTFTITGTATPGVWTNAKNDNNWFNCGNWENLTVPNETVDVTINALSGTDQAVIDNNAIDADVYNKIAKCKNLTIAGEKVILESDINNVLEIHGNLTITNGKLDMDDNNNSTADGKIFLYGNWNNSLEARFLQGNGTVDFVGTNPQNIICNAAAETEVFYNLILDNNFTTNNFNSDIIAQGQLELTTGKTLLIKANHYASITKNIINNGQITVEHNGSLAQLENVSADNNSGAGTYIVHKTTKPYVMYDYTYWSSPIKSANINTVYSASPLNYIYRFNTQNFSDEHSGNGFPQTTGTADSFDDTDNDWEHDNGVMTRGKGYIVMGEGATFPVQPPSLATTTQSVVFNGKVNNGLVNMNVYLDEFNTTNGSGNSFNKNDNLIGNPYPSAIDAAQFLSTNTNLGGTLYFWTHDTAISTGLTGPDLYNFTNDDYAIWNTSGGVAAHVGSPTPTGFIASGQGFFVTATQNEVIHFNNDMRVATNNNLFFRPKNRVWLNLTNSRGLFRQILIGFFENATNGEDRLYDGLRIENGNNYDFYSLLNNKKMAIQGLAPLTENEIIPIGVEIIEAGTFKITIDHIEGELEDVNIYIKDKLLHTTHRLNQAAYNFTTNTLGNINDRFEIVFSRNALQNEDISTNNVDVIIANTNRELQMYLTNNKVIKQVSIYNTIGQLLVKDNPNTANYSTSKIDTNTILWIQIETLDNQIIHKKFLFKK